MAASQVAESHGVTPAHCWVGAAALALDWLLDDGIDFAEACLSVEERALWGTREAVLHAPVASMTTDSERDE